MAQNDGQIPNTRGVRVHASTGYTRVKGNRRASRNGRVRHLPPEILTVTIRHLSSYPNAELSLLPGGGHHGRRWHAGPCAQRGDPRMRRPRGAGVPLTAPGAAPGCRAAHTHHQGPGDGDAVRPGEPGRRACVRGRAVGHGLAAARADSRGRRHGGRSIHIKTGYLVAGDAIRTNLH